MQKLVLIIDDDDDLSTLISTIVIKKGLLVQRIASVKDISTAVVAHQPSVVLMDNHLDDGLGVNFISEVKQLLPGCAVVLMTADDKHVVKHFKGYELIDGFLAKPFRPADLDPYLDLVRTIGV